MNEAKSKIEQVVVTTVEALAMQDDNSLCVFMTTPIPWAGNDEVIVSFWRKSSPPPWAKAA